MTPSELIATRRSLGLTQTELGQALGGIHYTTVLRWETGKVEIPAYLGLALDGLRLQQQEKEKA